MPWIQIHFRVPGRLAPQAAAALEAQDAAAVTTRDAGDQALFDRLDGRADLWDEATVTGLFSADAIPERLAAEVTAALGQELPWEVEPLADRDWATAWKDRYAPLRFGDRLWVCPSWCTPPDPTAINIILDPGMAFGTGTHATTALCLAWLVEYAPAGKTVADYGCGSGILAIAALKLGAREAWGVDIDPQAVEISAQNARQNSVGEHYRAGLPGSLPVNTTFDLVIANILADTLMRLAPELSARVAPNGTLILSGILVNQIEAVQQHYPAFTFQPRIRDDWAALIGTRRP